MKTVNKLKLLVFIVALGSLVFLGARLTQAQNVFTNLGVGLTPAHYPDQTPAEAEQMFQLGKQLGNYAAVTYQWSQPDFLQVTQYVLSQCQANGLTPIISLSPLTLTGVRNGLDVPDWVRISARSNLSFANPVVADAFKNDVLSLAQLKPPYLCLATEINLMGYNNPVEYLYFAQLYKQLYQDVKNIAPQTKVFVSFHWDLMNLLDKGFPDRVKEYNAFIDIFRPQLDVIAFTSFPKNTYESPAQIPEDYYSSIFNHVNKDDHVIFTEIGWPGVSSDDYQSQEQFLKLLPELMDPVNPEIFIWALLHDLANFPSNTLYYPEIGRSGLITTDGEIKPTFAMFKELGDPAPLPGAVWLLGSGLAGLATLARFRARSKATAGFRG